MARLLRERLSSGTGARTGSVITPAEPVRRVPARAL